MKRFLSLFTVVSIIASMGISVFAEDSAVSVENVSAEAETQVEAEVLPVEYEEVKALKAMGIFEESVVGENKITRAEILVPILGISKLAPYQGEVPYTFADVDSSNEYAGYIYAAKQNDIIHGHGDDTYTPDGNVDYYAAVKLVVSAMGYSVMSEAMGGYPSGYLAVANKYNMLDGITAEEKADFNYNVLAKLIDNCLSVNTAQAIVEGDGNITYAESSETLLERLDYERLEGIVTKNAFTSLTSSADFGGEAALIGEREVYIANSNINDYLGYNVRAYVKSKESADAGDVSYVYPHKNEVLTIPAADFTDIGFDLTVFEYTKGNNSKKIKVKKYFDFIYNGLACNEYRDALLSPASGTITLVDNNRNGEYDVVFVESGYDFVVDSVSTEAIYNKLGTGFDLDDENVSYTFILDGVKVGPETFGEWTSLYVIDSEYNLTVAQTKRTITAYVSTKRMSGKVNGTRSEDGVNYLIIGRDRFAVSKTLENATTSSAFVPRIGAEGTFLLNINDEVVGFTVSSLEVAMTQYAYLIKCVQVDDLDEDIVFKLFTTDDVVKSYKAAEKMTIDGETFKREDGNILNQFVDAHTNTIQQLIKYKADENGYITYIDTIARGTKESNFTLSRTWDGSSQLTYKSGRSVFADRVHPASDCLVMCVPVTTPNDESMYSIGTVSQLFRNDNRYTIEGYRSDDSAMATNLIVWKTDGATRAMQEALILLVESITKTVDEYDEPVDILHGWVRDGDITLYAYNGEFDAIGLDSGDIINYETNSKSELTDYKWVYDYSKDVFGHDDPTNPSADWANVTRKAYGKVYSKDGNKFRCSFIDPSQVVDENLLEIKDLTHYSRTMYYYDGKTKTVRKAQSTDIKDYSSTGSVENCTRVIMTSGYGDAGDMVIYNDYYEE